MLRKILTTVIVVCVAACSLVAQQPALKKRNVTVRKGVYLKFETLQPLDSATATAGDNVPLRLARPLVVDDIVLLPVGALANATVSKVERAKPDGRYGRVDLRLDRIDFADGTVAECKVEPNFSGSFEWVPEYIGNQSAGGWDDVKSTLGMLPLIPVVLIGAAIHHDGNASRRSDTPPTSVTPGKEEVMPPGTTIAVWITRNHKVRY
jgi:hypothetical protein